MVAVEDPGCFLNDPPWTKRPKHSRLRCIKVHGTVRITEETAITRRVAPWKQVQRSIGVRQRLPRIGNATTLDETVTMVENAFLRSRGQVCGTLEPSHRKRLVGHTGAIRDPLSCHGRRIYQDRELRERLAASNQNPRKPNAGANRSVDVAHAARPIRRDEKRPELGRDGDCCRIVVGVANGDFGIFLSEDVAHRSHITSTKRSALRWISSSFCRDADHLSGSRRTRTGNPSKPTP